MNRRTPRVAVLATATTGLAVLGAPAGMSATGAAEAAHSASFRTASTNTASTNTASTNTASTNTARVERTRAPHLVRGRKHRLSGASSSYNWAGYAESGTTGAYRTTTATWTVPTVSTKYSGYASTWVGVDGLTNQYLTQTGVEEDVVHGRVTYDAWWEIITPTDVAPETVFTGFGVHPGDSITGTVTTTGTSTTLRLHNNTTGATASHTAAYAGPGQSAEWIQEDTDVNGYISAAPNWHSVSFSQITVNGANPNLTYSQSMDIVDQYGTQETSTSAPTSARNGFTTTWLAHGTRTYAG